MFDALNSNKSQTSAPSLVLLLIGVWQLTLGLALLLFPAQLGIGLDKPSFQFVRMLGIASIVLSISLLIASRKPAAHWAVVFGTLLLKILTPFWLFLSFDGDLFSQESLFCLINDLVWWIPLTVILLKSVKQSTDTELGQEHDIDEASFIFSSNVGRNLLDLSFEKPTMLIFLRQFGCVFCREVLQDLKRLRSKLDDLGIQVALVHMSSEQVAHQMLSSYSLEKIEHFSDSNCELYRSFGFKRGSYWQLFNPRALWSGILAMTKGNRLGAVSGDSFRMPGIVMLHQGDILGTYRHRSVSDRPEYLDLAERFITETQKVGSPDA